MVAFLLSRNERLLFTTSQLRDCSGRESLSDARAGLTEFSDLETSEEDHLELDGVFIR